jgi:hypothetical protein
MVDYGSGALVKDVCPWLADDAGSIGCIIEAAERNNVIEGLPPYDRANRDRLHEELRLIFANAPSLSESPRSSADSPA